MYKTIKELKAKILGIESLCFSLDPSGMDILDREEFSRASEDLKLRLEEFEKLVTDIKSREVSKYEIVSRLMIPTYTIVWGNQVKDKRKTKMSPSFFDAYETGKISYRMSISVGHGTQKILIKALNLENKELIHRYHLYFTNCTEIYFYADRLTSDFSFYSKFLNKESEIILGFQRVLETGEIHAISLLFDGEYFYFKSAGVSECHDSVKNLFILV
jgi:hypothetical protein